MVEHAHTHIYHTHIYTALCILQVCSMCVTTSSHLEVVVLFDFDAHAHTVDASLNERLLQGRPRHHHGLQQQLFVLRDLHLGLVVSFYQLGGEITDTQSGLKGDLDGLQVLGERRRVAHLGSRRLVRMHEEEEGVGGLSTLVGKRGGPHDFMPRSG
jgi:hypothetical protein